MKLILFTRLGSNAPVWINPAHIVAITDDNYGNTVLVLTTDIEPNVMPSNFVLVSETPFQIQDKINKGA